MCDFNRGFFMEFLFVLFCSTCSLHRGQQGASVRPRSALSTTDFGRKRGTNASKHSDFSERCWLFLNKPSHWSKRSHLLAAGSTTEPPDRAASQQKFTSMPSESCFMCVLPANRGRREEKGLKETQAAKCNSEL